MYRYPHCVNESEVNQAQLENMKMRKKEMTTEKPKSISLDPFATMQKWKEKAVLYGGTWEVHPVDYPCPTLSLGRSLTDRAKVWGRDN